MAHLTHYSKKRISTSTEKKFCNEQMVHCFEKYVNSDGIAIVLDDKYYNSTKTIQASKRKLDVYIAQHDENEFNEMMKSRPSNVRKLINDDYSKLTPTRHKKVVIDNADFCCSWVNAKDIMINRLRNPDFYADRAIVRITLCARPLPKGKKVDEHMDDIVKEYIDSAFKTEYAVKLLSMNQWIPTKSSVTAYGFPCEECGDAIGYAYGSNMINMIFVIIKL